MRTARLLSVALTLLVVLVVEGGCGSGTAPSATSSPAVTLAASSAMIALNGSTTLTWSSTAATSVSIDQGVGAVASSGQVIVKPTQTTTYTISATGAGGSTTASVTVTVSAAVPAAAPTVTIKATPATVVSGGVSTLTVAASNATSVVLSNNANSTAYTLPVTGGAQTVTSNQTTTYTATATGGGGTVTAMATVTVTATPPTVALTATPAAIFSGRASTLSVIASNATSVVISNNVNSTTDALSVNGGTQVVNPSQTTTYIVTAFGVGGSATATATVTVSAAPPTVTLTANPATISSGGSSTLTATASNGTSVVISNNEDSTTYTLAATGGTQAVNPTQTTTYTVTAIGGGGSVTATATVTVTAVAPTITLTANPATISSGGSSTLTLAVSNATSVAISNNADSTTYTQPVTGGTQTVSPTQTTTYTATARGIGGSVTATATVTVTPTVVTIIASPSTVTLIAGQQQQFTSDDPNATWSIKPSTSGTISNTGLFTAGTMAGTVTVTATDAAKSSSGSAIATLIAFAITPNPATVVTGQTVTLTSNASATWAVTSGNGSITNVSPASTTATYNAPTTACSTTITATAAANNTITATDTVTVAEATPPSGVYTYKYDNGRTGLNPNESKLAVAAVTNGTNFGLLGSWSLDGSIFAQPLYVPGVAVQSVTYNLVYVATENDSVYALNADKPGTVLWKRSFLTSAAAIGQGYTGGRTSIGGNVGITGTPVIDPLRNWMYVVVRTTEGGNQVQRLHAIDITTGADVLPAAAINSVVSGTGDGTTQVTFLPLTQNQRPALLLNNGIVYVTFASFGDYDPYHGWMIAFDAATLNFIDAYNATPNGAGGGSWMAGAGPAGDSDGNVYFATGNGRPDATAKFDPPIDLPNSLLKLKVISGKLKLVDYFSPYNATCLSNDDLDLGSSGPTLIPDQFAGYSTLAIASKEGRAYLLDQNNLGTFHSGNDSQILSSVLFNPAACGQAGFNANSPMRVYGSPAYWNGNIYFGSAFGPLQQYNITNGQLAQTAVSTHIYQANGQLGRGPLVMVSSNGTSNAIVWTAENDLTGKGWLRAFDATNVANELYHSNFGGGSNFIIPMVSDGHVYVTGQAILYQYGLLN